MRKTIYLLLVIVTLSSCKKEPEYVYKAFHRFVNKPSTCFHQGPCIGTDYFYYPEKNDYKAREWYNKNMMDEVAKLSPTDSTWIEYYCTADEFGNMKSSAGL